MNGEVNDLLGDVTDAFDGLVAKHWGTPSDAPAADLQKVWSAAIDQSWCDLDEDVALPILLTLARVLGRHACPLPLADAYVAARLLRDEPQLAKDIRRGLIRPLVVASQSGLDNLEAASGATHLILIDQNRWSSEPPGPGDVDSSERPVAVALAKIDEIADRPGLAVPPWSSALAYTTVVEVMVSEAERVDAINTLRLFLAARGMAASARSHELALEYAKVRTQFGKPIGSFGAIQQRTAAAQIDVAAAESLLDQAASTSSVGSADDTSERLLSSALAIGHVTTVLPRVQLAAQHTFGAVGYFEEHEAPWLFRRGHADLALLSTLPTIDVADFLIDSGLSLPDIDTNAEIRTFRRDLRAFVTEIDARRPTQPYVDDPDVLARFADAGYLGMTWPDAYGGRAADPALQSALIEEVGYGQLGVNIALNGVMFLGDALISHGTPEQQDRFLPMLRSGDLRYCLGYSEPENGSDLAGLRTRATRDGDEWVVNGQKTWTTRAQASDWIWLAVRTSPDPTLRHRGLTVFLVPLDLPGVTIHQHRSLSGETSCSVFFENVRIPDSGRVGEVDGGWTVINTALAGERTALAGIVGFLRRQLDDLVVVLRENPDKAGPSGSAVRARISSLACGIQGARLLTRDAVAAMATGGGSRLEAPMASVMSAELAEECGETSLAILGPEAALAHGTPGAAADGTLLHGLLLSVKYVVGGGTNDVLRGLIARSLGLPR